MCLYSVLGCLICSEVQGDGTFVNPSLDICLAEIVDWLFEAEIEKYHLRNITEILKDAMF